MRYRLTPDARDDLRGIREYLTAAPRKSQLIILSKIRSGFDQAVDFPYSGLFEPSFFVDDQVPRSILVGPYRIFYLPGFMPVPIVAILHGAQDIPTILAKRFQQP
jgi:plasmid stabilization system protein ParE